MNKNQNWLSIEPSNALASTLTINNFKNGDLGLTLSSSLPEALPNSGSRVVGSFGSSEYTLPVITVAAPPMVLDAGEGNDLLGGSNNAAGDILNGGDGNDFIAGGGGRDVLLGGAGYAIATTFIAANAGTTPAGCRFHSKTRVKRFHTRSVQLCRAKRNFDRECAK